MIIELALNATYFLAGGGGGGEMHPKKSKF
jgi:hypothetical protein